jgi:ABC-type transporter Mla subunit MlaD
MPRKRHSELAAGLFVLAGLAVGAGVVLWLGAAEMFRTRGQEVVFRVNQAAGSVGVLEGAPITLGDAEIGRVHRVEARPAEGDCLYHARLERTDIAIRGDADAVVVSPPIGQAKIVLLYAGGSDQLADANHPVALHGGLDQFMTRINVVAENIEKTSQRIRQELEPNQAGSLLAGVHAVVRKMDGAADALARIAGNVEGETLAADANSLVGKLHRSAGDVNAVTASLARQMDPNAGVTIAARLGRALAHVDAQLDPNVNDSLMRKVRAAADDLAGMLAETRPKVKEAVTSVSGAARDIESYTKKDLAEILASLREANTKILKIAGDFSTVSEQAKQIAATNRDNIDETLDNLALVSINLKAASEEIRRNPWRLLHSPGQKELRSQNLYAAVRSFSDAAAQLDQAIAKLRGLKEVQSDTPEYAKARQEIIKSLTETFEKFHKAEEGLWKELQK